MAFSRNARAGALLAAAALLGGALWLDRPESAAARQATDYAYVHADFTVVAPRVAGTISQVLVEDHQQVAPGDLLATLDDRDFAAALAGARARVDGARAALDALQAEQARQQAAIRQAAAAIDADDASLSLARAELARYRSLAAEGSGTVQQRQQAQARLDVLQAGRAQHLAALEAARRQAEVLDARLRGARASLAQAEAAHTAAQLQLSYTRITAPVGGMVGHRTLRVGAQVQPGKPLLAIVPLEHAYVEANFRETQLARVRPGQRVRMAVDALPGVELTGRVASLGPASGVSYAPIAPHNATGNFTKIVQRIPVRIEFDAGQPALARLRVGMSVRPEIETGPGLDSP
ncbi:HlyD family secretion protein [Bordetella genomosp. 2]|uniref:Efflux transporter periplasmic adaptor subunit n=1 Tax=Bordetella genomosp. 2 TaxID=1983456 RepID=A0A261VJQ7_9BORD|nr:HlyD family secretion protein [Bordetella genomosp. 2]OZI73752.1 efflux transporter periplasmic adaptor subunit [Bordetella genomosp. 2]